MTRYLIDFFDPTGHLIDVTMSLASPIAGQTVSMCAWIPGSYMIREFARCVTALSARQNDCTVSAVKLDKQSWRIDCVAGVPLEITYRVYAWDRSVRTNYFDASRGFVNPAALLLRDDEQAHAPCSLRLAPPKFDAADAWKCATAMSARAIDARGFGEYFVADFDELIDHPIECAAFDEFTFTAGDVQHRFVVSGRHRGDLERLQRDTQKICQAHIDFFHGKDGVARPPFDRYLFQLHVVDEGYGGLEHRASTALICPRHHLPVKGDAAIGESYLELLALISHEYFHAWNVKRIKPAAFTPYSTDRENYTRLLWLFEGFTSYYDELMLLRAGLITEKDYLKLIARHLTQLLRTPGREKQSLAESSFDAWIKYYRPDENSPNAQVSYYLKGGLIALLLDLTLRREAKGTLDDVMRDLWREFGATGVGVPEDVFAVFERYTGLALRGFEADYVNGVVEPNWRETFAAFGIAYEPRTSINAADRGGPTVGSPELHPRHLGIVLSDAGETSLRYVLNDSAAHAAGLCAGDVLAAIDGLRATRSTIARHLARFAPGEKITLHYFRHDVLHATVITVPPPLEDTVQLRAMPDAAAAAQNLRTSWLSAK